MKTILAFCLAVFSALVATACTKAEANYSVTPKVGQVVRTDQQQTLVKDKEDVVYGVGITKAFPTGEVVEIEYLKNGTDYKTQTISVNGYHQIRDAYVLMGVGYAIPEIGKEQGLVNFGVGYRYGGLKDLAPKIGLRHTYHITDGTQDTAILGGVEYKFR